MIEPANVFDGAPVDEDGGGRDDDARFAGGVLGGSGCVRGERWRDGQRYSPWRSARGSHDQGENERASHHGRKIPRTGRTTRGTARRISRIPFRIGRRSFDALGFHRERASTSTIVMLLVDFWRVLFASW